MPDNIDWKNTTAHGEGGYYSRIFLNVKGREPEGTIEPNDYEKVRNRIKALLEATTDKEGKSLGTRVLKPEEIYATTNGFPPDLIVYFGDLRWRSIGSIGHNEIHTAGNDTGLDDANHAPEGILIMKDGNRSRASGERRTGMSILDVFPTLLDAFNLPGDPSLRGRIIR
jgi:predicted AlkP superfamily phosphohydrolase/phosphomutase